MGTKVLEKIKNQANVEAFRIEDQSGTTVLYIDNVATTVAIPGVTSTAAELNQLHSQGAVAADFAKLHAVASSAAEIDYVAHPAGYVQTLTASGAVLATTASIQLNHATVAIAATMAAPHNGFFVIKDTSASGTASHTVTLTGGTFDGTHTIATLAAPGKALVVYFDSAGNGVVVANVGTVGLS